MFGVNNSERMGSRVLTNHGSALLKRLNSTQTAGASVYLNVVRIAELYKKAVARIDKCQRFGSGRWALKTLAPMERQFAG